MKKLMIAALVAGFAASPAFATELESHCAAVTSSDGGDPSGCSCLAQSADDDMTAELLAVQAEEDVENLSQASKDAIAACWPEA